MWRRVTCEKCGSTIEYDTSSRWEGNREFENIGCPECKSIVAQVFTDLIPQVRLINRGSK